MRADGRPADDLVATLGHTLDEVRREWIAADPAGWIERNVPYCDLAELAASGGRARARRCWSRPRRASSPGASSSRGTSRLADIQGKEAGTHKCENLRALIAAYSTVHGRRPRLWFVEDRPETLEHVTTHSDLADVGLFLAAWGYNTPEARASLSPGGRIRLLELDQFRRGLATWPTA